MLELEVGSYHCQQVELSGALGDGGSIVSQQFGFSGVHSLLGGIDVVVFIGRTASVSLTNAIVGGSRKKLLVGKEVSGLLDEETGVSKVVFILVGASVVKKGGILVIVTTGVGCEVAVYSILGGTGTESGI